MDPGRFDCSTCQHRHCDDSNPAGFDLYQVKYPGGEITTRTCLLRMITDDSRFFMKLHVHYSSGFLAYSGNLLEQPNRYLRAIEIIGATIKRIEAERIEDARRKNHTPRR